MPSGTRAKCREVAAAYGANHFLSYRDGDLAEQILAQTQGRGVDKVCIAGGGADTFDAAIRMVKPGGIVASVNYLGEGDFVNIPRAGMGLRHGAQADPRRADARRATPRGAPRRDGRDWAH